MKDKGISHVIAVILLSAVPLLCGCGDALPPAPMVPEGGNVRIVFTERREDGSTWSEKGAIMAVNPDGSGRTEIARGVMYCRPAANRIAFSRNDSIFVATWSGGSWNVTHIPLAESNAQLSETTVAISPDGRLIAYTLRSPNSSHEDWERSYLAAADGSGTLLPLGVVIDNGGTPAFSADGRKLAFYGPRVDPDDEFDHSSKICMLNTAQGDFRVIGTVSRYPVDGSGWVDFSPDGKRVVYADSETDSMYIATVDGSASPRRLPEIGIYPIWYSGGEKIVYTGMKAGSIDLMMINADGSGIPVNLTNATSAIELYHQFSPDGRNLVCAIYSGDLDRAPGVVTVFPVNNPSIRVTLSPNGFKPFWMNIDS